MDIYREEVLDHCEHPRNRGVLTGDDVLSAQATNASCGDSVQFYLRVQDDMIVEVKWEGVGCAIMSASASKLSEYLLGRTLKVVEEMSEEELSECGVGIEVNAGRSKCLLLPILACSKLIATNGVG